MASGDEGADAGCPATMGVTVIPTTLPFNGLLLHRAHGVPRGACRRALGLSGGLRVDGLCPRRLRHGHAEVVEDGVGVLAVLRDERRAEQVEHVVHRLRE